MINVKGKSKVGQIPSAKADPDRLQAEIDLIINDLIIVKESGFGELRVEVADGVVVRSTCSIKKRVELKPKLAIGSRMNT